MCRHVGHDMTYLTYLKIAFRNGVNEIFSSNDSGDVEK